MNDKSIFEQEDSFSELVKNAKRKSIRRSILISLLVTISILVVLWAILYIGQYFMYERMYEDAEETNDYYGMYGANISIGGTTYDNFFVAGRTNTLAYKEVNGHLIKWDSKSDFHTILGTKATLNTSTFIGSNDSEYKNDYKVLKFHLPGEETIQDDSSYLKTLPGFYSVEVALSFHKEMTLNEVNETFPTANWLWVLQDYIYKDVAALKKTHREISLSSKQDFSEVDGDNAVGFSVDSNTSFKEGANQYINFLQEKSDVLAGAKDLSQMLEQYEPDQIPVTGVILTGTVDEVLPYITKEPVRVVRTGIIIPY